MSRQTHKNQLRQSIGQRNMQSQLSWSSSTHNVVVSGTNEISTLSKLKNIILSLRKDWFSQIQKGIRIQGHEDYQKRLLLLENQMQGLLKRKINYTSNEQTGQRVLDYSTLLNEKENQITELEKKIQNLQARLRKASARELQLEDSIVRINEDLKSKEDLIIFKHNAALAELAVSTAFRDAFNRIKRNIQTQRYKLGDAEKIVMDGVVIPDLASLDIKADIFAEGTLTSRSRVFQQQTEQVKLKTRLVQFFREFQRLANQSQGASDFEIQRVLQGFLMNMKETKLYQKSQFSIQRYRQIQDFRRLKENFNIAAGLFADLIAQLKADNINYRLPQQVDNIFDLLQREKVVGTQVQNGAVFIDFDVNTKLIEVPVQDARTKHLIHLLAHELRRLFLKYPTIQGEIDSRLGEFLQQEVIDVIEADQVQKLIQIVKFVPQIVRVQNVYTNSNEKQRKIEFHLRILIKALLEELQKIRVKTGVVLEIDEGVIGMIRAEIMDVINVDDILKVFRVTPKLVEVEKIVEKIVERVVQVPKVVTVDKIIQKIVQVEKIKEVEKIIHVPIDKPLIVQTQREKLVPYEKKVQTVVEVPTIVQKLVEVQKIVPQVMEVEVFKQKIVQKQIPVQIEKIVNHIQTEFKEIEVSSEKIVPVEKIVERIIEVPVYVEKIVQKVVQIPKIVEVERVVQKIVDRVQYRTAREVENHVEVKYQIVDRIVQKIVPIIQVREKIKEVPQIIEVIKQANNIITEIKEVEVIKQKLVIQQEIKEVVTVETRLVEVIKEVPHQIQRFIEVPIIKEVPVIKELIVEKPVIQRIESVHIKEVVVREPFIVKQPVIVQVQKYVNVYVEVPKMVKYIEEKIVEVPTIVDRIKEVPVTIEKIIEKMVEVPKVVEVQKIVEKIVVVPRVIEKVVQVPQIVEKVIEKEIIRDRIVEVQKIVHVPVIQQVIKEVQTVNNVFIQIEKPVEKIVQKAVEVQRVEEKVITRQVLREVPINVIQEVPVEITVDKIVHLGYQCVKPIEVERHVVVPIEIPVPVEITVERIVAKEQIVERIIPTPQIIEKIVPVVETVVQVQQIERIVERILVEKEIREIQKIVPYIQQVIKEVPTIIQKVVVVEKNIDNIVTVERIIQKVIQKTITLPQIYQVERVKEKLVEVPRLIQIEKIVPQIIRVNQYIHKIAEKLIEVPTIIESIKEVVREQQKVVPLKQTLTEIVQVEKCVEKLVYAEKLKEVVRNVNYIEKVLQIIDRIEQVPVAVTTSEQKLIEVPYILQKIVEKIVVMPQIVEVLKYVHEVCQVNNIGVAVDVQVGAHELKYKQLTRNIEIHLDSVLKELRYLKNDQGTRKRIQKIENFLEQLRKFILVPRIVKVVEQKIVEKQTPVDRIVRLPVQDEFALKKELSMSILIEKLIAQLKRIKQRTGATLQLDEDIKLLFFSELNANVALDADLYKKLQSYTQYVNRQFQSLGNWSSDHQLMLNSFLQQRFLMAELLQNTNQQLQAAKTISEQNAQFISKFKEEANVFGSFLGRIAAIIRENRPVSQIVNVIGEFERLEKTSPPSEHTFYLGDLNMENERFESLLRQKEAEINLLKDKLAVQQRGATQSTLQEEGIIKVLKAQNDNLRKENNVLLSQTSSTGLLQSYKKQIQDLQARNLQLQGQISRLKSQNYNLLQQKSLILQNVSFRREPESAFQEVDLRQSAFDRSRFSQSSQGVSISQYESEKKANLPQYTQSVFVRPGQSEIRQSTIKKDVAQFEASQQTSRYRMTPTAQFQRQTNVSAQKPGMLDTALSQSQRRETGAMYQSYPLQGQRYQNIQGQGSQVLGNLQGSQLGGSIISGLQGSQIRGSQVGGTQIPRSQIKTFGVQQGYSSRYGQSGIAQRSQLEDRATLIQSGVLEGTQRAQGPALIQTQSRVEQVGYQGGQGEGVLGQQSGFRQTSRVQGGQGLYSSRQQFSKGINPTTQTFYQQGQGQQSRGYIYGAQQVGLTGYQPSVYSTPIESYKFTSPSPSAGKLAESIVKQQQSLSKLQAQTPEVSKKQQGSRSQYRYYTREQPKKQ